MDFFASAPVTPHHKMKPSGGKTVSFENVKTPHAGKLDRNANNTPHPGKGQIRSQNRKAFADISNTKNALSGGQLSVKPSKPSAMKKSTTTTVKSVSFTEDVDFCSRQTTYRATPYKPEVEDAVRSLTANWYSDEALKPVAPPSYPSKVTFADFEIACDDDVCVFQEATNMDCDELML